MNCLVPGMYDASDIVDYAQQQPSFRQISQTKYLSATTTRRVYHNITKVEVESPAATKIAKKRKVDTYDGKFQPYFQSCL